jgi:hypothetical protein
MNESNRQRSVERPVSIRLGPIVLEGNLSVSVGAPQAIEAATLFIVGGHDTPVIDMNRSAYGQLVRARERNLEIIPGATHLFTEPGALEEVARLARDWFKRYLVAT